MKLSLAAICTLLALLSATLTKRLPKIETLRALRPKVTAPARKLSWLADTVGNPYNFSSDPDGDREEALHRRNMLMYMDINKKEADIRKLLDLVREFPEKLDDFSDKVNDMLNRISMVAEADAGGKTQL